MIVVIGGTQAEAEYYCKLAPLVEEIIAMGVLPSCTLRLNGLRPDDVYFVGTAESNSYFNEAYLLAKNAWQKFHEPVWGLCGHCSAIFEPVVGLRRDAKWRKLAYLYRHVCPDGHIENKFETYLPITDEDMEAFALTAAKVLKDTR